MRGAIIVLVALLWAAPARASELTFENLWPYAGIDVTGFGVAMWSSEGESIWFYEPGGFQPVAPGDSWTLRLPGSLDSGFSFNWLDVGGTCPQNCGWGTSVTDTRTGAWIGAELREVNALWPTADGGMAPVVRMTFRGEAPATATADVVPAAVPEPGTLALMLAGGSVLAWRRRRLQARL